ncbi:hypothetical protein VARIO8X_50513 [Burkholderiales bacterium 8X]|nr:hypothetical protein VARIO8X_50513 [Burkholderiales bacterium 8X]
MPPRRLRERRIQDQGNQHRQDRDRRALSFGPDLVFAEGSLYAATVGRALRGSGRRDGRRQALSN